jgi:hypothetical protein
MLWDFWALPLSDAERVARMKRKWCQYVFHLHERPMPDNNNYERPDEVHDFIRESRQEIARMMQEPDRAVESKMRLEWWSANLNRLERNILNGSGLE